MITYLARATHGEPERLRFVVDELERQFAKKKPKRFLRIGGGPFMAIMDFGDRKEAWTDDAIEYHTLELPELRCFQIEKSRLNDVRLWWDSTSTASYEQWRQRFEEHAPTMPLAILSEYLLASNQPVAGTIECDPVEAADYTLAFRADEKRGMEVHWGCFRKAGHTPATLKHFFNTCISACGLGQDIYIEDTTKGFRLLSDRLQMRFTSGEYDPHAVHISVPDISTAAKWHDLARTAVGGRRLGMNVHLECREDQYAHYRTAWNALGCRGWTLRFDGSYVPGFDPFTASLPAIGDEPVSYPLLYWEAGGDDLYYQCNVAAAPEGRYLELLTNVKSEKKVKERLKKVDIATAFRLVPVQG